jgi:hypothetical protein
MVTRGRHGLAKVPPGKVPVTAFVYQDLGYLGHSESPGAANFAYARVLLLSQ